MDNIKQNLVVVVAVVIIAVVAIVFGVKTPIVENTVNVPEGTGLGAFSGPEILSDFLVFNGIEKRYFSSGLNRASTTLCTFQTPAATSTLRFGSLRLTTGSTTALFLEWGKSADRDSTSTSLGVITLPASDLVTMTASTTRGDFLASVGTAEPAYVFAPSTYLTAKVKRTNATPGSGNLHSLVGACKAEFVMN